MRGAAPRNAVLFARAIDPDQHRHLARRGSGGRRKIGWIAGYGGHGRLRRASGPGDGCPLILGRHDQRARRTPAGRGVSRGHLGGKAEQGQQGQQEALCHEGQIGRAESLVQWD